MDQASVTCGAECGLRDLPCLQSAHSDGLGAPSTVGQLGSGQAPWIRPASDHDTLQGGGGPMPRPSLSVGPEEVPTCLGPHSLWVLRSCPRAQVLTECGS